MNRSQLKPMSIVEIQQVQLECVKQIHNFCRKKNLTYFLAYGSLIGAVRHRGPIPWDDDIDVYMPRPDYERFVQEYPDSAVYRVFSPMKRNSLQLFSRLCEMRATFVKTWAKWADSETGVWVDVFPLDAVSSDDVVHEKRMSQIDYLWHRLASSRLRLSYIFSRDFHGGLRSRIKAFLKVLIYSPLRKKWLSEAMQIMRAEDWQRSALVGNYADRDGRDKMQMPKEWFAKQVLLPYADTELNAPFGWDAYLKHYFGDYMTPPPVDKRAKHAGWQTAYWKV